MRGGRGFAGRVRVVVNVLHVRSILCKGYEGFGRTGMARDRRSGRNIVLEKRIKSG